MSNLKKGLEELLKGVPYHSLKDKFIELGIGEAFKAGVKKVVLIERAVELLEVMDTLPEGMTFDEVKEEVATQAVIVEETRASKFNDAVKAVASTENIWTKETIEKRIVILGNIFAQHRGTIKGKEALDKQEILKAASKLMF